VAKPLTSGFAPSLRPVTSAQGCRYRRMEQGI
jgi:hypothetical protein